MVAELTNMIAELTDLSSSHEFTLPLHDQAGDQPGRALEKGNTEA